MNRKIDEEIAELVFGWTEGMVPPDANKQNGGSPVLIPPGGIGEYVYPALGPIPRFWFVPRWSSNRDLALDLVKSLRNKPYFFEFIDYLFLKFGMGDIDQVPKFGHQVVYQYMMATPDQITEAVLEAVKLYNKLGAA